jgi:hypothetical protein
LSRAEKCDYDRAMTETTRMVECPRCGTKFDCDPVNDCWCAKLPPLPMSKEASSCFCPACLRQRIADELKKAGD